MKVFGEAAITKFARKYPNSRNSLSRFLAIARQAQWAHFPAVKESFPAIDYAAATETLIFDVGGNKYRVIARVSFKSQELFISQVLTHKEYDREDF